MKKKEKKSPLKEKPLRNPGQSLDEEINYLWDDKAIIYFLYIFAFLLMMILDWYRYLTNSPIKPITSTVAFLLVLAFCSYKLVGIINKVKQLKLARDGEKLVGQYFDELREGGARILHDIKGPNFNVDHLIISEHGIFVVDTKTYQKPLKGDARVKVINDEVYVNNYKIERNPIKQSRALVKWIAELLMKTTGRKYPIKGVVVFPGWFVEPMNGKEEIWVLNNKALPMFVQNSQIKIPKEDVILAYYHLSSYVRSGV